MPKNDTLNKISRKMRKAKFEKPRPGELKEIIESKRVEFVQRQNEYRESILLRIYKQEEISEMRRQIESGDIQVEWTGMKCPLPILKARFNLEIHKYKEMISRENYMRQSLKNDGLSDEQMTEIIDGKLIKEVPK